MMGVSGIQLEEVPAIPVLLLLGIIVLAIATHQRRRLSVGLGKTFANRRHGDDAQTLFRDPAPVRLKGADRCGLRIYQPVRFDLSYPLCFVQVGPDAIVITAPGFGEILISLGQLTSEGRVRRRLFVEVALETSSHSIVLLLRRSSGVMQSLADGGWI